MNASSIRRTFLDFFARRGHTIVPSSSLIPDDPTLLLTNAGMVQFKPYFLGQKTPPYPRATTVQKCFRTVDLEEIGRTTRHLTFFEMLGNFSFGDYFKRDACRWAWQLVTEEFGLDPDRLWATAFLTDTLEPLLRAAESVTGTTYGESESADMSLRVLADHPRATAMLIADGVLPSNEGRGYVLRRLIRRAVRHARLLGVDRPLLADLADVAVELFGPVYPEVARTADLVRRVVSSEESRFDATLRRRLSPLGG